jgi:hypothetical protein
MAQSLTETVRRLACFVGFFLLPLKVGGHFCLPKTGHFYLRLTGVGCEKGKSVACPDTLPDVIPNPAQRPARKARRSRGRVGMDFGIGKFHAHPPPSWRPAS